MQINNISIELGNNNAYFLKSRKNINKSYQTTPISFMGKSPEAFYPFNANRLPEAMKETIGNIENLLDLQPKDVQKNAYAALMVTKTIQEVKKAFPNEEAFKNLLTLDSTESKRGLIGIYKDFKEIFPNGILKSGENFTVYILRELYTLAKKYDDINDDLENDLLPEVKTYFQDKSRKIRKSKGKSDNASAEVNTDKKRSYIDIELLRGLGIQPPDSAYRSSLLHTDPEFSADFVLKVSEGVLKAWEAYTPEQRAIIQSKKLKGLVEWWNDKTHDERLEMIAKITEKEEFDKIYDDYKNYRKNTYVDFEIFTKLKADLPEYERDDKKKELGANFKDKDLFALWMKGNLERYRAGLTEEDKEILHLKMSRRQAERWAKMSPAQKTEYINKLRTGGERQRYVMIDAWNHSRIFIRVLSEFLHARQVSRPFGLLYSSEEFKLDQSQAMTEFWAENDDLAKQFFNQVRYSHRKIEEAIKAGQFETLKEQIDIERAQRKRDFAKDFPEEFEEERIIQGQEVAAEKAVLGEVDMSYRKDFINAYRTYINKYRILPASYFRELNEIMLDTLPKDFIVKCTEVMISGQELPADMKQRLDEVGLKNNSVRMQRMRHALEAALACVLSGYGGNPDYFGMDSESLVSILEERMQKLMPKKMKPDTKKIEKKYNEFKQPLTDEDSNNILAMYFRAPNLSVEQRMKLGQEMIDYMDTYGQSIKILYLNSLFSDEQKNAFNKKFLKNMPQNLKDNLTIGIKNMEDIKKEREIIYLQGQISKRLGYIPSVVLNRYKQLVGSVVRFDSGFDLKQARSLSRKIEMGQEYNNAKIEKTSMNTDDKLRMIAIEQALEDELYRVTKDYSVYSLEFEDAVTYLEMMLSTTPDANEFTVSNGSKTKTYIVREKPNVKGLTAPYVRYYRMLKARSDSAERWGSEINASNVLFCLRSAKNNPDRNYNIRKRIQNYFDS